MGLGRSVLFRVATSKRLERAVKRVPGGERAAWRSASRYVASRSRSGALATAEMLLERGHGVSVDLFGERLSDPAVADAVLEEYLGPAKKRSAASSATSPAASGNSYTPRQHPPLHPRARGAGLPRRSPQPPRCSCPV